MTLAESLPKVALSTVAFVWIGLRLAEYIRLRRENLGPTGSDVLKWESKRVLGMMVVVVSTVLLGLADMASFPRWTWLFPGTGIVVGLGLVLVGSYKSAEKRFGG